MSSSNEILKYFSEHISFKRNNEIYISVLNDEIDEIDEQINKKFNSVLLYSFSNPKRNIKILKYIIDIIFMCMKDNKIYDDINIHKFIKMCLINATQIGEENIKILLNYLMEYLTNIIQSINEIGHQKNQNNLKKLLELLYYTNFYINIDVIKDKFTINQY